MGMAACLSTSPISRLDEPVTIIALTQNARLKTDWSLLASQALEFSFTFDGSALRAMVRGSPPPRLKLSRRLLLPPDVDKAQGDR